MLTERLRIYRERRRRGAREARRIREAEGVLFSPGNSGRTWLRAMLSRALELHFSLGPGPLIDFDNRHKEDARVPRILVTHNRWLRYYRRPRPGRECACYYQSRVLVLVRNPLDTAVSQYFQWRNRSKDANIKLKGWPARTSNMSLLDFMLHRDTGVEQLCRELNTWHREAPRLRAAQLLRYEDMLVDTATSLATALAFFGIAAGTGVVEDAVAHASFENMRQRESTDGPLVPNSTKASCGGADSFKARRGGVGGYTEYLGQEDCARLEALVADTLHPSFGYSALPAIAPTGWQ
tara:strand:+ start:512 stop:1393 length:882 start_codon:yes stop_codon:yes gene_type:complete